MSVVKATRPAVRKNLINTSINIEQTFHSHDSYFQVKNICGHFDQRFFFFFKLKT